MSLRCQTSPSSLYLAFLFSGRRLLLRFTTNNTKMTVSSAMPDHHFHVRSISLPSRSDPLLTRVEEELHQLRATLSPSTSTQMCDSLQALGDLYDHIEELFVLPQNQQALAQPHQKKIVEVELDGSVRLLELCSALRSILIRSKEHVQDLQSSLRRKDASSGSKVRTYIQMRKKAEKDIKKCLASLKQHAVNVRVCDQFSLDKVLMEAMEISLSLIQSIASFLLVSRPREKISRWSLVSKALQKRKIVCEQEHDNDPGVESLASTLNLSYDCLSGKLAHDGRVQKLQYQLEAIEANIEALETGLDCLFRRLLRNRVSLLNTLSF